MIEMNDANRLLSPPPSAPKRPNSNCCRKACIGCTCIVIILFLVILTIALTLFKPKNPSMELISAKVEGVSPRVTFPKVSIQLNLTLELQMAVKNPNRISFKHGTIRTLLFYRDRQIADSEIPPGKIPARGSTTMPNKLVLEMDQIGEESSHLASDIVSGKLGVDTVTRVAGRIGIVGIKKHISCTSTCHIVVSISDMKLDSQECKTKAKL